MPITDDAALMRLLTKIHDEKGTDFTQYKEKTLLRRINSRLNKYDITTYDEYIKILDENHQEYIELINSLSINVTEFFRNPESFHAIEKIVIPRVIFAKYQHQHKIIKAWSCGCSSADEPYSLAILFLEKLGKAKDKFLLTIIGSDIDEGAIEEARHMIYSKDRLRAVDKKLLEKYFDRADDDRYILKSALRGLVRLKHHDIITDEPFMHCDIILCRNLLIYFNKELQEEVILKFYHCLNPGGFLVLGMTESLVGSADNIFEYVDNRLRIYRKPDEKSMQYDNSSILSQDAIDNIVNDMLQS